MLSVNGFVHNKTKPTTLTLLPEISVVTLNVYLNYENVKAVSFCTHAILTSKPRIWEQLFLYICFMALSLYQYDAGVKKFSRSLETISKF